MQNKTIQRISRKRKAKEVKELLIEIQKDPVAMSQARKLVKEIYM